MTVRIRRALALVLVLVALATPLASCAGGAGRVDIVSAGEATQQARLERLQKIAIVMGRVGVAVQAAQTVEIVIANTPNSPISPETHRAFQSAVLTWANAILSIRPTLESLTRSSPTDRIDVIQIAIDATDRFLAELPAGIPESLNIQVRSAVATVQALLPMLALIS